jgi:hypothetical protein
MYYASSYKAARYDVYAFGKIYFLFAEQTGISLWLAENILKISFF